MSSLVQEFYDSTVEVEWRRLDESWIEFGVTMAHVNDYLPATARVLDLGGGPGRYAFTLAEAGHSVDLVDLSPACVEWARNRNRSARRPLADVAVANAVELSGIADQTYDAVLSLGPQYHLTSAEDRRQALAEAVRVLRPGGVIFLAYLSCYAPIYYQVKTQPQAIREALGHIEVALAGGPYLPGAEDPFFTEAYFVDPAEVEDESRHPELELLTVFGSEGLCAQSESRLRHLSQTEQQQWLSLMVRVSTSKAACFASEHIVAVARRRT